jgi:hypothetical protein
MLLTKVLALCGVTNSGTTLMLDLLRAHPRILAETEVGILNINTKPPYVDPFAPISGEGPLPPLGRVITEAELEKIADKTIRATGSWQSMYAEVFDHIVAHYGIHDRDILVDRSVFYIGYLISHVFSKMPDIPTLVMVRDPRAVYCSWCKRPWYKENPVSAAHRYAHMTSDAVAALDADRPVLLVRFEDVVLFPEQQMSRIAEFIGIDYDPAMTSPANSYAQDGKTMFTYPHWVEEQRKARPVGLDHSTVDEWRELLEPGVADAIAASLPEDLDWVLYDRGKDMPHRSQQVRPKAG